MGRHVCGSNKFAGGAVEAFQAEAATSQLHDPVAWGKLFCRGGLKQRPLRFGRKDARRDGLKLGGHPRALSSIFGGAGCVRGQALDRLASESSAGERYSSCESKVYSVVQTKPERSRARDVRRIPRGKSLMRLSGTASDTPIEVQRAIDDGCLIARSLKPEPVWAYPHGHRHGEDVR